MSAPTFRDKSAELGGDLPALQEWLERYPITLRLAVRQGKAIVEVDSGEFVLPIELGVARAPHTGIPVGLEQSVILALTMWEKFDAKRREHEAELARGGPVL